VKRSAPFAVLKYATTAGSTISSFLCQAGNGNAFKPTLTIEAGSGVSLITFANSFDDDYGVSCPFQIRAAIANASTAGYSVTVEVGASYVRTRLFNSSGAAANGQLQLAVW
jgi:hypothetical protein